MQGPRLGRGHKHSNRRREVLRFAEVAKRDRARHLIAGDEAKLLTGVSQQQSSTQSLTFSDTDGVRDVVELQGRLG